MLNRAATGILVFIVCGIGGWVFGEEAGHQAFSGNKVLPIVRADVTGAPKEAAPHSAKLFWLFFSVPAWR